MRHNRMLWRSARRGGTDPTVGTRGRIWVGLLMILTASVCAGGLAAVDSTPPAVRLNAVSARVGSGGASVVIETSEPVAYVTTRPDPLTVLVDVRNATTAGVVNRAANAPVGPVAAVTLEDAKGADGAPVARVRVLLASPTPHKVHSERNLVHVDLLTDGTVSAASTSGGPSVVPSARLAAAPAPATATRLEAIRTANGARGIEVTLAGNGNLVASGMQLMRQTPPRLVLDFNGVASAVPPVTPVAKGVIERVRVAAFTTNPLVTRVVFDLAREVPYTVKPSGNEFKVIFSDGPASPGTAAAAAAAMDSAAARPASSDARRAEPSPTPAQPQPQAASAPPATPPAPVAASPAIQLASQAPGNAPKQYSGNPISMDFAGADLRAVLRVFSEQSNLNLVIDPKVEGTVDVSVRDVPWDQALDMILRTNKLGWVVDGTIVRVAPLTVLSEEEGARRKLQEEQVLSGELKVITKTLSYAQASEVEPLLKANALSSRGTSAVDRRTNTVIINDLPSYLAKADALLTSLDQPEGQVEIEAKIVSTSKTFARELGIKWGFLGQAVPELGNNTGLAFPNSVTASTSVGLGSTTLPSVASLVLGSVNGGVNLNLALAALERDGRIKILLTPRVVTQNNVKARVARGQEIPYTTTVPNTASSSSNVIVSQPTPTVQFKTAALTMEVTPRITPSETVLLDVDVDNGSPGDKQDNGNISINTQRAQTRVLVKDGATTVIGGIYSSQNNRTDSRTPVLGKVPLLRWLFKSETQSDEESELLIFITPRIMRVK